MTSGGIPSCPGALPQATDLMALLRFSIEGRMSSSTMTGRFAVPSTAASVTMFSLE